MDNDKSEYFIYESSMIRLERIIKRLWILCIILILLLVGTNIGWIWYESQFVDEIKIDQEIESEDSDNYITGIGNIGYGENENKTKGY